MIVHLFNSSIVSGPETLALPALRKIEERVVIVFLSETRRRVESLRPLEYARALGHEVHSVEVRGRWDKRAFSKLRDLLEHLEPRIVHAHDVKASLYLHRAKKLRPGFTAALVSTHHGASARKGKIRLYEEFYVRRVLPHFDRVIAVCHQDQTSIVRRGNSAERVLVHLNGTDRPEVRPSERASVARLIRERWRKQMPNLPRSDDTIFLGAVARLSSEKRHDRMLNVLREVDDRAILLCFGTGPLEADLRARARALGVEKRVFWMGYSTTISEEMAGLDMLLCLSDGEGIPISFLEAGWAATPVFTTSVGGIPDLISSDVGYLVEKSSKDHAIGSRLAVAMGDRDSLHRKGALFQKRVISQFSESTWLNRLRAIYAGLNP